MKKLGICKTPGFVQCKIRDLSISGKIRDLSKGGKIRDLSKSGKFGICPKVYKYEICKTPGFVQSWKNSGLEKPRDLSKRVQCGENQGLST